MTTEASVASGGPLILPIGHDVGAQYRPGEPAVRQIRRGAAFHDLTDEQHAVWSAAHGTAESLESGAAWQRSSVEEQVRGAGGVIDDLLGLGLLAEVASGEGPALEFASSHRLVPLMLGLGNTTDEADMFGIGFLHQPVLKVSYAIYDLWQWSTMDDSLWATCQNAADVARRAGSTQPDLTEAPRLLGGMFSSLHALLLANAAYLDVEFRLRWPDAALAAATEGRFDG